MCNHKKNESEQVFVCAGALTGILSKNSIRYGVEVLPLLSIISGVICLGVFASGLDQCVQFVPLSVVQGFSVGVAFSIGANQLDFALGLPKCVFPNFAIISFRQFLMLEFFRAGSHSPVLQASTARASNRQHCRTNQAH
jgi:MFS superfamily sulfate permease-like transporter